MIPDNMVIITMHGFVTSGGSEQVKFEIKGAPYFLVGYADLVFFMNWAGYESQWASVAVQGFSEEDGTPVNVLQTNGTFTPGGATVNRVSFLSVPLEGARYYKYELIFTRASPKSDVFTVDPTLMVRRL